LRIRPSQAKQKIELTPLLEVKFLDAVQFLKDGKTIKDLRMYYSFDAKMEKRLEHEASL